jgi:hypothetical protein
MAFDFNSIPANPSLKNDFKGLEISDIAAKCKELGKIDWFVTRYDELTTLGAKFNYMKFRNAFIKEVLGIKCGKKAQKLTAADFAAEFRKELSGETLEKLIEDTFGEKKK